MKETSKFIVRSLIVIAIGIAIPVVWYLVDDPFKVLHHYDDYIASYEEQPVRIGLNKGMVTLTNFNDRRKEGHEYNSFIFGSSISIYYNAQKWADIVSEDSSGTAEARREVRPYHMDSSSETLSSMARKIRYLDKEGIPIDHALIVLDPFVMAYGERNGPAYLDPPVLATSIVETLKFHYQYLRAGTNADFYKSYIPSMISKEVVENGRNILFEVQPIVYDKTTNQELLPAWDSLIRVDSRQFYAEYPLRESPETLTTSRQVFTAEVIKDLKDIRNIFDRKGTDYEIIIGPNRPKITLNPKDLRILNGIFGERHVHDFSSSMAYLLEEDTMLYDNVHYRPVMAEILMTKVYCDRNE